MEGRKTYSAEGGEFIIEDYNNAKAFASFLPAIAGLWGKPLWVYYVNRGQAITNFGVRDKDGAMLEFVAANKAWRLTTLQGFRTFIKINGVFHEAFRNYPDLKAKKIRQTMAIKSHSIKLFERNMEAGTETEVVYYTLPNENFPALLRQLTLRNISGEKKEIECIDGLPMLIPWGTRNWMLKNMSRLGEGWFAGVDFSPGGVPYYKLPVEALDKPEIVPLSGAHFYAGCINTGINTRPLYCIDPDTVFGHQTDFDFPAMFLKNNSPFTVNRALRGKNKTPSAMGYFSLGLESGESAVYYSMAGHCSDYNNVDSAASLLLSNGFFETKDNENEKLLNSIAACAYTQSAYPEFDTYCGQNFIDNALRGGYPVNIGKNTPYYAYSRVHGDMEREYNNFVVLDEYFSQGNGNYRDVNQNRRSDLFFNRNIGDDNIHFFMNLIQTDGFNPLVVHGVRFIFEHEEDKKNFLDDLSRNAHNLEEHPEFTEKFLKFDGEPLTIGALFNLIEECRLGITDSNGVIVSLLKYSKKASLAEHGDGYWSDHWHYNTDLMENYLSVFPDRIKELLFDRYDYTFYDDCYFVEPRSVKYVMFRGAPRQIGAVRHDREKEALILSRKSNQNTVRIYYGSGAVYYTNLFGKLLFLIANKYASLDPEGLGLEMESDKPNWCDALNGLPGLFGSSSSESLELLRLVSFVNRLLAGIDPDTSFSLAVEMFSFLIELEDITKAEPDDFSFWDKTHEVKESFREITRMGLSGVDEDITVKRIEKMLKVFEEKLLLCRKKLENISVNGIVPTCFEFIPESYDIDGAFNEEEKTPLVVHSFKRKDLPLFLEGPVHYLRLCPEKAADFHRNILASPLYDHKLRMLKINAPMSGHSRDIGRTTVFTPGWLENESVWLHMEYKYLYELLRNGLYTEFFNIAETALVPFFKAAVYGRSIFENSSFIVSSAHPDKELHGQGFVARLSGATAEFISIWIAMTSGINPFFMRDGELCLELKPCLSAGFFTEGNTFSFNFLGSCRVTYHNKQRRNTFGKHGAAVQSYRLTYNDGIAEDIAGSCISDGIAQAVRDGKIQRMDVELYE